MKTTKRIFTLALALMMILALAVPAFADNTSYTITIKNNDLESADDHKYDAYQIFSGKLDESGTILTYIEWGESIDDGEKFLEDLMKHKDLATVLAGCTNAESVSVKLYENQSDDVLSAFAEVASAHIDKDAPVASSGSMATIEGKGYYYIEIPLEKPGYYLVLDDPEALKDKENKDVSDYILQVVGDVTVEHKGSIPSVDKSVSETGATYGESIATGIGETHYYRIKAELPDDYKLYDVYKLQFVDTMSESLTYESVVVVKALIRSSKTELTIDPSCYEVNPKSPTPGATMTVTIDDTKLLTTDGTAITLEPEDAIEVIYTAKLNEKAVADGNGIPNNAYIIYSNDPKSNGTGKSNDDETNVYPINLKLVKEDGTSHTPLADATFILSRTHSTGTTAHAEYAVVVNGKISKWVHHYAGDGCADNNTEHSTAVTANELGTPLTTLDNGTINVGGLDAGSYSLIEIEAPDSYTPLTKPVEISVSITIDDANQIVKTMTGTTNQGSIVFTPDNATVTVTIPNYQGKVLPSTGGIGTTLFYLVGGMMAVCATVVLITKKRMAG